MHRTRIIASLTAAGTVTVLALSAGGAFQITSHTIDCGGGTSTSGSYQLAGTIGQPVANAMSSASYQLQGGFWMGGVVENCPADLSDDGIINVTDLFQLLANWNTSGPGADLAPPTNIVNVSDLFVLLAAWGACP